MILFAKVLILFVIVCLPEIRTELGELEDSRDNEKTVTNSSNASTICHFHISESSQKSVLKFMQNSKTNVIKLNLWIESVNDTMTLMNKNRMPTDMLWVNELGRTLYSLKLKKEQYMRSLISYLPDVTLTAGFRDVNIVVSEDNERCLLSKNNTMDHAIFDLLLSQLYSVSDVKTDYQFCHTHNLALNCCRIFPGDKNIRFCSYYLSPVSHFFPIITVTIFAIYLAFPAIVDYLSRFKENDYYTISNSPMALSYIFYAIFFKGQNQGQSQKQSRIKSFGRKLIIATFVLITWLPLRNIDLDSILSSPFFYVPQYIGFFFWALIFLFSVDMYSLNVFHEPRFGLKGIGDGPLEVIAWPFNLKSWQKCKKYFCSSRPSTTIKYTPLLNLDEESQAMITYSVNESENDVSCFENCKSCISIFILFILYLGLAFPISCVFALVYLPNCIWKFYKGVKLECRIFRIFFGILVFGLFVYCSTQFFGSMVLFTIGVFLNGETYINYFLPLSTILFFSWTNWKSSVETKYLVLNTCIYEVCKDSTSESNALASEVGKDDFDIKLNIVGEPVISTKLYDSVRKEFLPYHRVLFYYFLGIFFVTVFAYFLYTMLSLSEDSGVTSTVQILGSMAATALPIIFNLVWKHSSDEQKEANAIALKAKLRRFLKIHCLNEKNEEFKVELNMEQTVENPNTQNFVLV